MYVIIHNIYVFVRSHLLQLANKIPVEYTERSEPIRGNDPFMNYGLWVTTIIFLSFMLAFQIISAGLCFYNTVTVPIETLIGPMGIYLSNGVVGMQVFLWHFLEFFNNHFFLIIILMFV